MAGDFNKLNRLEELKTKLSGKHYRMKIGGRSNFTHPFKGTVANSWEKREGESGLSDKIFSETSVFKKFFIFAVIFFLFSSAFAAYTFFIKGNTISNSNIGISVLGNPFAEGGTPLPLQIEIANKNSSALLLADLLVEYPKSASNDLSSNAERQRISLGTIPAGGIRDEKVSVVLYGEQGSVKPVKISLEYRVEGSNAIFVKEKNYQISINSAPINLSADIPSSITPGQNMALNIKTSLNSTKPARNIMLTADYPVGFEFVSATPAPSFGNNAWFLGDLAPGTERDISITGKMVGVGSGEEKTFHIYSGSQSDTDQAKIGVVFNSLSETVAIQKPIISALLYVNGAYQERYAVDESAPVYGEIHWANNLDTSVNDMQIVAKISGNAVDPAQISSSDGFYNSSLGTITWDKNSVSELEQVAPSASGVVKFTLSPLPLYGPSGLLQSPSIVINVSVSGKQPMSGNSFTSLKNSESKIIRIISDLGLSTQAFYYSGPFQNSGPVPPKAGEKTTYTITWSVTNTANNISKARVKSTLPPWVDFIGSASPPSEDFSYDPAAKSLVWNIGNIPKGAGITGSGRQVSFQIEFTPSLSQVGSAPTLVNDAILTGYDDFANVDVTVNKTALSTRLGSDPSFPADGDRVVK